MGRDKLRRPDCLWAAGARRTIFTFIVFLECGLAHNDKALLIIDRATHDCLVRFDGCMIENYRTVVQNTATVAVGGIPVDGAMRQRRTYVIQQAAAILGCCIVTDCAVADA